MANLISPQRLRSAVKDGKEFALLDVRERGQYARGHLFLAINLPLSHLELRIKRYVPRLSTRVLLCDAGEGFAQRAAHTMEALGYSDVSMVEGGVRSCTGAGFELFRGHYAVPYAFGLYAAKAYDTPQISPQALRTWIGDGEPLVIVDSRTAQEFEQASIPGAVNVPLSELPYHVKDLAPHEKTRIVVHCGAVTRGILGGQSLIELGVKNPVRVLSNGVRGWDLADFDLSHSSARHPRPASRGASSWAAAAAQRLAAACGVRFVSATQLNRWREDASRTLYVVDIRTREEYEAGHLHDAIWILGGELIGLYEDHIGTRNARFCLVDDNGARAICAASWLTRMGWPDVTVLEGGTDRHDLIAGPGAHEGVNLTSTRPPLIEVEQLMRQIEAEDVLLLDFADSLTYEQVHIAGAWWALRSTLPALKEKLPACEKLVCTSPDGQLASLAAADLRRLIDCPVAVLAGGTDAWRKSGGQMADGLTRTLGEVEDVATEFVIRPGDDRTTVRAAQRRMLRWQAELLPKLKRDQTFSFPALPRLTQPN